MRAKFKITKMKDRKYVCNVTPPQAEPIFFSSSKVVCLGFHSMYHFTRPVVTGEDKNDAAVLRGSHSKPEFSLESLQFQ